MANFLLSIIIPVYNEENNIDPLLNRLLPIIKNYHYEIVFVDDGSIDKTAHKIKSLTNKNSQIKLISFLRNYGHQMAITCGYKLVKGDCVITLDADLQDPPEIIPAMISKWQKGYKVVYGQRNDRQTDSLFKKITATLFYKFVNFLSDIPIPEQVGDFRLMDKKVIKFLNNLPEQSRFLRGLTAWPGYSTAFIKFKRDKRYSGKTHYSLSKMVNFALEGITSFSIKPLRLASYLGFISATIGFSGIIYALFGRIFLPQYWVTGWTTLFVGIMFLGGVQLITIGIIGEYIGKIYKEVQRRPQYMIKEKVNI